MPKIRKKVARKPAPRRRVPAKRASAAKKGKAAPRPILLYFWPTPNGLKISIMLEECGLPYELKPVNIGKGEQFTPEFLRISPNNRIPAIVDPDGPGGKAVSIFESGAILQYLGRKSGKFYPADERKRLEVDQWVFWQVANLGPMCGQAFHFRNYSKERLEYPIERYSNEVHRLYKVMNARLSDRKFLAGAYSIADIASYRWASHWEGYGFDIAEFPNVNAWLERIAARPAVKRGEAVGADLRRPNLAQDEEARKVLFNQR